MTPHMVTKYTDSEDEDGSPVFGLWMWKKQFYENVGNNQDLITYKQHEEGVSIGTEYCTFCG